MAKAYENPNPGLNICTSLKLFLSHKKFHLMKTKLLFFVVLSNQNFFYLIIAAIVRRVVTGSRLASESKESKDNEKYMF